MCGLLFLLTHFASWWFVLVHWQIRGFWNDLVLIVKWLLVFFFIFLLNLLILIDFISFDNVFCWWINDFKLKIWTFLILHNHLAFYLLFLLLLLSFVLLYLNCFVWLVLCHNFFQLCVADLRGTFQWGLTFLKIAPLNWFFIFWASGSSSLSDKHFLVFLWTSWPSIDLLGCLVCCFAVTIESEFRRPSSFSLECISNLAFSALVASILNLNIWNRLWSSLAVLELLYFVFNVWKDLIALPCGLL